MNQNAPNESPTPEEEKEGFFSRLLGFVCLGLGYIVMGGIVLGMLYSFLRLAWGFIGEPIGIVSDLFSNIL